MMTASAILLIVNGDNECEFPLDWQVNVMYCLSLSFNLSNDVEQLDGIDRIDEEFAIADNDGAMNMLVAIIWRS